jgi:hypothetical protein
VRRVRRCPKTYANSPFLSHHLTAPNFRLDLPSVVALKVEGPACAEFLKTPPARSASLPPRRECHRGFLPHPAGELSGLSSRERNLAGGIGFVWSTVQAGFVCSAWPELGFVSSNVAERIPPVEPALRIGFVSPTAHTAPAPPPGPRELGFVSHSRSRPRLPV